MAGFLWNSRKAMGNKRKVEFFNLDKYIKNIKVFIGITSKILKIKYTHIGVCKRIKICLLNSLKFIIYR